MELADAKRLKELEKENVELKKMLAEAMLENRGLKVRPKPKKIPRRGVSTGLPTQATHRNHVWTWDFSAP